jgi:hypothetical protein
MSLAKKLLLSLLFITHYSFVTTVNAQYAYKIAKLKYGGGGDWYANKTSMPNLIKFCNQNLRMNVFPEEDIVEPGSPDLFSYPFIHLTGHGNVVFSESESRNLRKYLISGGFLHLDDNYGLDKFIRREMKKVFNFTDGLPKVHEHDAKAPQGFGLFWQGRLVCFYSYECDLGNGWEDQSVYNDPEEMRQLALRMGANLVQYALTVNQ